MQFRSKTIPGRIVELSLLPSVILTAIISNTLNLETQDTSFSTGLESFAPIVNLTIDTADFMFPFAKV